MRPEPTEPKLLARFGCSGPRVPRASSECEEEAKGMGLVRIRPTSFDRRVAQQIAARARPVPEDIEKTLTWGADEHLLLGGAAAAWTAAVFFRSPLRAAAGHLLIVTAVSAAVPHVLKTTFEQVRPIEKH